MVWCVLSGRQASEQLKLQQLAQNNMAKGWKKQNKGDNYRRKERGEAEHDEMVEIEVDSNNLKVREEVKCR